MTRSRHNRSRRCNDCGWAGCDWCWPKRVTVEKRCPDNGLDVQRREIDDEPATTPRTTARELAQAEAERPRAGE